MTARPADPPRAIDCQYLRRTIDASRADGPVICVCDHPVRSGFDCVGPFLEDLPTECGLWEEKRRDGLAPFGGSR